MPLKNLPRLDPPTMELYLRVLSQAVVDWKPGEQHELHVVFPKHSRPLLERILRK